MTRPLLRALAQVTGLEVTFLTVFDWSSREQSVLFTHSLSVNEIVEGTRLPLPADLSPEALTGVTRSPQQVATSSADGWIAKSFGFKTYVSVPVALARHQLFGMVCGASRGREDVGEPAIDVMESFAKMIADCISRERTALLETRALNAEGQLLSRARFFAAAEHELKTYLTVLEGTAATLRDRWRDLGDQARTDLTNSIVRKTRDLSRAVEQMLLEARAEIRAREFHPTRIDVTSLIQGLVEAYGALGTSHDVVLTSTSEIEAFLDPTALNQVVAHLLDNAIKFSPDGGEIRVALRRSASDIHIDVADQGIGLPSDIDVFEPFSRGKSAGEQAGGIGLGLHIVRSIVDAMNGRVSATTNPGGGSTFQVRIPA